MEERHNQSVVCGSVCNNETVGVQTLGAIVAPSIPPSSRDEILYRHNNNLRVQRGGSVAFQLYVYVKRVPTNKRALTLV